MLKLKLGNKGEYFMKGLIVLSIFATLMLAFGIQGTVGAEDNTVPVAARYDIAISEIMYVTNADKLPQWIELHNRSGKKVSLEGWKLQLRTARRISPYSPPHSPSL